MSHFNISGSWRCRHSEEITRSKKKNRRNLLCRWVEDYCWGSIRHGKLGCVAPYGNEIVIARDRDTRHRNNDLSEAALDRVYAATFPHGAGLSFNVVSATFRVNCCIRDTAKKRDVLLKCQNHRCAHLSWCRATTARRDHGRGLEEIQRPSKSAPNSHDSVQRQAALGQVFRRCEKLDLSAMRSSTAMRLERNSQRKKNSL